MEYVWAAVIVVSAVVLGIVGSAFVSAYAEFKARPKVPMEFCGVHGFFKKEHALSLPGTEARMCPRCYCDAMQLARKG